MRFLVTGGAGSIGECLVEKLVGRGDEVVVFDHDGTSLSIVKQDFDVDIELGDVTNTEDLSRVFNQYDFDGVFHAAALKQVPLCQQYPAKAFEVNVGGTKNVLEYSDCPVVNISTDKAVNPVSIMGMTKHSAEEIVRKSSDSVNVRFGNVLRSAGSVIPLFEKQEVLTVTDMEMTRFFMSKEEAADLLVHAFENRDEAELFVPEMRSFRLEQLVNILGPEYEEVGARDGEKKHEELVTKEELGNAKRENGYLYVGDYSGVEDFDRTSKTAVVKNEKVFDIL